MIQEILVFGKTEGQSSKAEAIIIKTLRIYLLEKLQHTLCEFGKQYANDGNSLNFGKIYTNLPSI